MRLLFIGGYPPPFGGITVHIQRLVEYCKKHNIIASILYSGKRKREYSDFNQVINLFKISKVLKVKREKPIVHLHVSAFGNPFKIYLLTLLFKRSKKVLTLHSGSFIRNMNNISRIDKLIIRNILKKIDWIITVNDEQRKLLADFFHYNITHISTIPAFIYPVLRQNNISPNIRELGSSLNKLSLITSGYLYPYYGFDMLLDFLETQLEFRGLFVFYIGGDLQYRKYIIGRIEKMDNADYVENLNPDEFNLILRSASVYIRNTDRDGDCVAIREAAFWGTKVIATNSVNRPAGTKLMQFNNKVDFELAVNEVLRDPSAGLLKKPGNNAEKIVEVYHFLYEKEKNYETDHPIL